MALLEKVLPVGVSQKFNANFNNYVNKVVVFSLKGV